VNGVPEPADDSLVLNVLVAFPYFKPRLWDQLRASPVPMRLLVDCGAYTVWNTGASVSLDDYCRAIETLPVTPWRYFALDVIGDADRTRANLAEMLRRGFKPSPVLTPVEDVSLLNEFFDVNDLVGFATYKPRRYMPDQQRRVRDGMRVAAGRNLHLLGFTSLDWVKVHRPYSIDSSTWLNSHKYGAARVYLGRGKTTHMTRDMVKRGLKPELRDAIVALGFDPYALADPRSWEVAANKQGTGLVSRIDAASWCISAIDQQRAIGTRTFFVVVDTQIERLLQGWATALTLRNPLPAPVSPARIAA
jgi:hypothetical protein